MVIRCFTVVGRRDRLRQSATCTVAIAVKLAFRWGVLAEEPIESAGAVTVWATEDGIRVNPETGRYFEDRTDVHADYSTGDHQTRDAIWDAASARIVLHAARNEFVSFQIIVDSERPISGANLRVGRLHGPDGATISGRNIASCKAWYPHVAKPSSGHQQSTLGPGWYPDALLPSEENEVISFDIPDQKNAIGRTQRNQSIWVDIYVPPARADALPGPYGGQPSGFSAPVPRIRAGNLLSRPKAPSPDPKRRQLQRSITMHRVTCWIGLVCLAVLASPCMGQVILSNTYENLDTQHGLADTPVTLSRIGADGDFTKGITPCINGRKLPAQVDVLRRASDGSIRHALVSFVMPKLAAGGTVNVDWLNEKPHEPAPFEWGFDRRRLTLKLVLTTETDGVLTSDVGQDVADDWSASPRVKILRDGPVMKEYEVHDVPVVDGKPDPEIDVFWRLRVFTGQRSVRVSAVVERTKLPQGGPRPIQYKFKRAKLLLGDSVLYETGPFDHLWQTRYRIVTWTDGVLDNIHRRPNYDYWVKGKFFPKYRFTQPTTRQQVDEIYAKRTESRNNQRRNQGILEPGIIHRHMPGTGGRWEMEPYPAWSVAYVLSGAPKTYQAILHADGNGGGAFYVHVRQDGAPGYDVRTVRPRPLDRGFRIPLYQLPDGTKPPVQPDHAHAPSLGYVAYLLTGDQFYAEEASFWASFQLGEWPHKGLRWQGMDRAFAYGLRHVVDAAFILPDNHPLLPYFTWGVHDCMDQMTERLVHGGRRVHSPPGGVFRCSGRYDWVNAKRCSAWQYAWVVWSLGNAADKGFKKAEAVRDWAAEYIVGFYTSDDEFKGPDGKTYRYDPRDAMPYSTATQLLRTELATGKDGAKGIRVLGEGPYLENYGAIWYYTKLNEDNAFPYDKGPSTEPDAAGNWPLRKDGWGHGYTYSPSTGETRPAYGWHRYGAWVGIVTALEANVPNSGKAWEVMRTLARKDAIYGYEMIPRTGF